VYKFVRGVRSVKNFKISKIKTSLMYSGKMKNSFNVELNKER